MSELAGSVKRVFFHSGSYYIFDVEFDEALEERTAWTARGHLFGLDCLVSGVPLRLIGDCFKHKNGRQFKVTSWRPWYRDRSGFQAFFSDCIRGADYASVNAICEHYGDAVLEALSTPARILSEVSANEVDLASTILGWEQALATCGLSQFLKGMPVSDVAAAVRRFGPEASSVLHDNPYRLLEIPGFSFQRADEFATSLGLEASNESHPNRVAGAVLWALNRATQSGHLFVAPADIPGIVVDLPSETPVVGDFNQAVRMLAEKKAVVVEGAGVRRVYLPDYFRFERASAARIASLLSPATLKVDLEPFIADFQRTTGMDLSEAQKEVVRGLARSRVLVITGLPGTGKSTSVRALVSLFEQARLSFMLMAPTGIASKRLSHITGYPASTIHRALGYDGNTWKFDGRTRLPVDAVIVDEMSMVDQELIHRLLESLRPDTVLVLVGDAAQLPSVGPGNVLKELSTCDALPRVNLTRIFRQSSEGGIVSNSHRINSGKFPDLGDPRSTSEFKFVVLDDDAQVQKYIVRMAAKLKERDANFQVLSAMYGGLVGVDALNRALREVLNPPGSPEWRGKTQQFRVGDRVMVIKNDYKKGIYNGDVGKLLHVRKDALDVRIYGVTDDMRVSFGDDEAEECLRLAYAVTVHKSQGNEFDTIIMPVVKGQGRMLQRNLLYTGVTRAKTQVWLLGTHAALRQAINNNRVTRRNTVLSRAITGVCRAHQPKGVPSDPGTDCENLRTTEDPQPGHAERLGEPGS